MQKDKNWFLREIKNIDDLKDNLSESELNMVYLYIINNVNEFTHDECKMLLEALSIIDDKFTDDEL